MTSLHIANPQMALGFKVSPHSLARVIASLSLMSPYFCTPLHVRWVSLDRIDLFDVTTNNTEDVLSIFDVG